MSIHITVLQEVHDVHVCFKHCSTCSSSSYIMIKTGELYSVAGGQQNTQSLGETSIPEVHTGCQENPILFVEGQHARSGLQDSGEDGG